MTKTASSSDLESAPGVGPSIARALRDLGFYRLQDLHDADPQTMYDKLRVMRGGYMDRCVLYVFRCAVYFANNSTHDPELLKWWNWKDRVSQAAP
ncbi:MAG: helix-hairpin-helix domain-containing protein [Gemmatimonadales bacterium]